MNEDPFKKLFVDMEQILTRVPFLSWDTYTIDYEWTLNILTSLATHALEAVKDLGLREFNNTLGDLPLEEYAESQIYAINQIFISFLEYNARNREFPPNPKKEQNK